MKKIFIMLLIILPVFVFATLQDSQVYVRSVEIYPGWDLVSLEYWSESTLANYCSTHSNIPISRVLEQRIDTERDEIRIYYYFFNETRNMERFLDFVYDNWRQYSAIYTVGNAVIDVRADYQLDKKRFLMLLDIPLFDIVKIDFADIPEGYEFVAERLLNNIEVEQVSEQYNVNIRKIREQRFTNGGAVELVLTYYLLSNEDNAQSLESVLRYLPENQYAEFRLVENIVIQIQNEPAFSTILQDLEDEID